jgi:hypothetical protein
MIIFEMKHFIEKFFDYNSYDTKGKKVTDEHIKSELGEEKSDEELSYFDKLKREIDEQRARTHATFGLNFHL